MAPAVESISIAAVTIFIVIPLELTTILTERKVSDLRMNMHIVTQQSQD